MPAAPLKKARKPPCNCWLESPGATAIQAVNDLVALGTAKALLAHGWKIPHDISLVGFGNCLTAEYGPIPATTVRLPKFRLGQTAMQLLERCLRGERPPSQRLMSELIVRASTAAPSGGTAGGGHAATADRCHAGVT